MEADQPSPLSERPQVPGPLRRELEAMGGAQRRLLVMVAIEVERDQARRAAARSHGAVERAGLLGHASDLDRLAGEVVGKLVNAARARGDLAPLQRRKG